MKDIQHSAVRRKANVCAEFSRSPRASERTCGGVLLRHDRTSLVDFLAVRYPVVRRVVGELSFRVAARRFILSEPPGVPIAQSYGDNFPRFIRSLGNVASIEYVADIAELEMLQQKAQAAADVRPLAAPMLSSLPAERLNGLRVVLHPSVGLVQSRFPIVAAWENNQTNDDDGRIERWVGEAALVARPFLKAEVRRLPPGGYAFLRALAEGQTVTTAAALASAATSQFEMASNQLLLDNANVIVGIRQPA